jgi:3-oxoacyl-[acyl-carrier-protein] synthase II
VTPLGVGTENFWDAALYGKSWYRRDKRSSIRRRSFAHRGECSDFDPVDFMTKKSPPMDRFAQLDRGGLQAAGGPDRDIQKRRSGSPS